MIDTAKLNDLLNELLQSTADADTERAFALENFGYRIAYAAATQLRKIKASGLTCPYVKREDGAILHSAIQEKNTISAPWRQLLLDSENTPSMITVEERQFFEWLGGFYSGTGAVIEIGPWLGSSTRAILRGLLANPKYEGKRLCVVDDFIWRSSWMDPFVPKEDRCPAGTSFRHLFDRHMQASSLLLDSLDIYHASIMPDAFNSGVKPFIWENGSIEMAFIDCGRTFKVNEMWYNQLSSYFIPEKTIIVMQNWRLFEEIPRIWFNQTREFTESKQREL